MIYSFSIIDITPVLTFFSYQQQMEQNPRRSKAHLGSFACTLDGFIDSTQLISKKPDWDWDEVINTMIDFWLKKEADIRYWQNHLEKAEKDSILVARVINFEALRHELEVTFEQ